VLCLKGGIIGMKRAAIFSSIFLLSSPAAAQDVRGLENCMAEKQIERRSGCLQANVEFLHQEIRKAALESRQKLAAAEKEIASIRGDAASAHKEAAVLKETLAKLQARLDELEKAKKDGK
jgi:septal ring factor EnvC (AmiA/AmiB activator)